MTDFKSGGVPTPDYDSDAVNYITEKTEFTDDVFVYGDTYSQSFNNVEISVVGSTLTFTVAGIGSTSLTLSWRFLYICYNKKKITLMEDFVYEVIVDICARTFKLRSSDGNNKIIACEDSAEFMRVLEVCDQMLEPHMIKYAELSLTTDK